MKDLRIDSVTKSKIVRCDNDDKRNYRKIHKLLSGPNKIDGIFSTIEKFALLTYRVCKDIIIKIQKDFKVISFSNLETADFLNPPLTTITQPANAMGATAASQLFKYLEERGNQIFNDHIIIKSSLTVRGPTN